MSIEPGQQLGPYASSPPRNRRDGEVWLARDTRLGARLRSSPPRDFAGAFPHPAVPREAQLLRPSHPNIAAIYSFDTIDEVPVLAMELVSGKTLSDWSLPGRWTSPGARRGETRRGRPRCGDARGILHRDLKPANVKVTPREPSSSSTSGWRRPFAVDGSGHGGRSNERQRRTGKGQLSGRSRT